MWGFQCNQCHTMARVDQPLFPELYNAMELVVDLHRRLAPKCRPSSGDITLIDWKKNPDYLPGPYYREINGKWKQLTATGQIR